MTDNSFNIKVNTDVVRFLKAIKMFKECIYKAEDHYSKELKQVARDNDYKKIFDLILTTYSYDLILEDDSIFQIHKSGDDYRYLFMQSYRQKCTFEEFLTNISSDESLIDDEDKEFYHSLYEDNTDDSCYIPRDNPLCIRYDVSVNQYKEGIHPYSHLHIGLGNEMRIPVSIVLTPEMFVMFAIKMAYPEVWKKYESNNAIIEMHNTFKKQCDKIQRAYWSDKDQKDLYII